LNTNSNWFFNNIYIIISVEQWNNIFWWWIPNFFKAFINTKSIKNVINCDNWIGGCYTTNYERDGKSYKSMVILESLTWKVGKDLNISLTYWINSKC
jgi:hypothetical protein